jgi:Cu/Ag efflux protein CusF
MSVAAALRSTLLFIVAMTAAILPAAERMAAQTKKAEDGQRLYTQARLMSRFEEGGQTWVRLKLVPNAKIPFATQALLLRDPALLAGIADGTSVEFQLDQIDGRNTVTALRVATACKRFQRC